MIHHPFIYDKFLSYLTYERILYSPMFMLPLGHYLLNFILLTTVVYLPPTKLRAWLYLPLFTLIVLFSPLARVDPLADNLTKFSHAIVTFQTINMAAVLLCTSKPVELTDYRLKYCSSHKEQDLARFEYFTLNKWKWAWCRCMVNMRGIGWSFQIPYVPLPPKQVSRWKFIIYKCLFQELVLKFLLYDFYLLVFTACDKGYFDFNWFIKELLMFFSGTGIIYYGLNSAYWRAAIISLSLGITDVEDWPDQFQIGKGGFRMRRFWSIWWHQYITRENHLWSKWLVVKSGIKRRSWLGRRLVILGTFFMGGLLHVYGSSKLNWDNNDWNHDIPQWVPPNIEILGVEFWIGRWFFSMALFLWSAMVVIIEDDLVDFLMKFKVFKNLSKIWYIEFLVGFTWMVLTQFWIVNRYIGELNASGKTINVYHKISLTSLI